MNLIPSLYIHSMYQTLKRKTFELLDPGSGGTWLDRVLNTFIVFLIVLNTAAVIMETVEPFYRQHRAAFDMLENFSVVVFTLEFLLRLWSCTEHPRYRHPVLGRLRFLVSLGGLVDLLAILPFYLPRLVTVDLRFMRLLRLLRFARFFKLSRYTHASRVMTAVFRSKREELVLSIGITALLIIIASSLMYYVEHDAQPEKFSSIPETMWWSVATLTTVGYGDVFPITPLGKTLTAVISMLGIGLFALPAGILASGFSEAFRRHRVRNRVACPHCGKQVEVDEAN